MVRVNQANDAGEEFDRQRRMSAVRIQAVMRRKISFTRNDPRQKKERERQKYVEREVAMDNIVTNSKGAFGVHDITQDKGWRDRPSPAKRKNESPGKSPRRKKEGADKLNVDMFGQLEEDNNNEGEEAALRIQRIRRGNSGRQVAKEKRNNKDVDMDHDHFEKTLLDKENNVKTPGFKYRMDEDAPPPGTGAAAAAQNKVHPISDDKDVGTYFFVPEERKKKAVKRNSIVKETALEFLERQSDNKFLWKVFIFVALYLVGIILSLSMGSMAVGIILILIPILCFVMIIDYRKAKLEGRQALFKW
jgi:hypothetical protein